MTFIVDALGLISEREKDTRGAVAPHPGESTPQPATDWDAGRELTGRLTWLLCHLDREQPDEITTGAIAGLYHRWRIRRPERQARRDLVALLHLRFLDVHGPDYRRQYTRTSKPTPPTTTAKGHTS